MPHDLENSAENGATNGHPLMLDPIEQQRKNFNAWLSGSGKSLLSVATKSNVSETGLRSYKNGATRDLKLENKLKIAEAHGLKIEDIFGTVTQADRTSTPPIPAYAPATTTTVPVFGRMDRGHLYNTVNPIAYVEAPAGMTLSGNVFAVRMPNTEMMPRFRLREILLVDPDDAVDQGDDAVIIDQDGRIFIMRCLEYKPGGQFVGGIYADAARKTAINDDQIAIIGRVVAVLMGA